MRGTQTGALGPLPPTGRRIEVQGMTVYYFRDGRIIGHRQVVDRLAVARQLGIAGGGGN
jgi:predicted ester cyclase